MTADKAKQETEWLLLYEQIVKTLDQFGKRDAFRKGDYWLVDDNWGWRRQQLEIQNLDFLAPRVVTSLQNLLADYPTWEITVRVDVPGKENSWPGMGVIIHSDEVVDELKREFLPKEFRNISYERSGH
jgi:hypothetical protein